MKIVDKTHPNHRQTCLPAEGSCKAVPVPHFPAHFQAIIWRNWGLVPRERLAQVIGVDLDTLDAQAGLLGLKTDDSLTEKWLKCGYQTIIRQNWHLVGLQDLLVMLGWDANRLAFTLKEDDFLWYKMGQIKPAVPSPRYVPLTSEQMKATEELRNYLSEVRDRLPERKETPFAFKNGSATGTLQPNNSLPGLRLAYSYSALYGDPLLDPELDPFPDADLERYAAAGVNALWMHVVLYSLIPWMGADNPLSAGWNERLENLRRLCRRLSAWNIQLYLYLDEPRGVTDDCDCVPMSWRGAVVPGRNARCLCTGNPEVLNGLRQAVKRVFTEVPELGGVFCITHNENPTHCWSRATPEDPTDCPVCRAKGIVKTIAEVVEAIASGVHEAKSTARVLAWNWDWLQPWDLEIIRSLPNDVTLMCTSENRRETLVGGIPGVIADYSISKPGPGPTALRCWQAAQERGLPIAAKVQVNNSWELSAVPYIPVPGLVEEHLDNLRHLGIQDFMLSWSLGGYPGGNLALLVRPKKELYREWFGRAADLVLSACACFESGFRHFPFNQNYMLYRGPHNHGPANLFHADPTGYKSTMVGFSYDDLKTWRGIYPEAVFETEYEKLCEYWQTGLKALESAGQLLEENTKRAFKDLSSMAKTAYCHFRSTYLHIRFIRYRDAGQWGREMRQVLQEEIEVTQELLGLVRQDSRLGFEASNHYSYTEQILLESILCCHWILEHRCALQ